ncbi:ABC transporter substrate-binding protein [Promicromonospora sp. NPDC057488]|uniref:ABC transporter substrate-binding protein n=1 Tax=Promicromonospora sp. NPDC057488 TaxID=3346147 RepID=UPI00366EB9DC
MKPTGSAAGAAMIAIALTLTACGAGAATTEPGSGERLDTDRDITISLAWWGDDDRAARYEQAVDLFEEKYPNITVQTQFQSGEDYWPARATEAAGGALPDVVQMDLTYLRKYGATGQLLDLRAQEGVNLDLGGIDQTLLSSAQIDGGQFGIPTSTNTLALFYNADVLERLDIEPLAKGYTWDELNDWIVTVSRSGGDDEPAVFGAADFTGTFWFFLQWLIQQGVEPFTVDGGLNFDRDDMARWLESGQSLREAGAFYPTQRAKQIEPLTGFSQSEVAADFAWDNFLAGYSADTGQDIRMLPMPSGDDGPQQFWKPSQLLSASANTAEPEAAAALIDFLVNEPEVGTIFGTSKGVPAVRAQIDAMDIEPGSVDEQVLRYEEEVADVVTEAPPIPIEDIGQLEVEYERLTEELQYGNVTVDQLVDEWFTVAESIVGQP